MNTQEYLVIRMDFIDSNEWVPVHTLPGYECCIEYYVNKQGQIKSTKGAIERILKPKTAKTGYHVVNLTQRIGRKKLVTVPIHTLVALLSLAHLLLRMEGRRDAALFTILMEINSIT